MPELRFPHVLRQPAAITGQGVFRYEGCGHDETGRYAIRGERRPGCCPVCDVGSPLLSDAALARLEDERLRRLARRNRLYPWLRPS